MAVKAGKGAIRRLVFAFVSCLAPCLGPGTAAAFARVPDSARLDRMQHIDSVVVVGTFLPEKVIPAQVLSGERLQRLNAHSVADAIRYFSGVQIKDYGGIGGLKTINVRGMGTQHVGVFYDGIQLGNAQNGQIDLGKYSLDNMAAVTLYNGQKSSGVQSARDYASASAVYLRTRIPEFREGRRCNLKLTLKGGSFGTVNPSVLYEQRLGERISNSLNAEFLYTTGRYRFSYVKADGYDTTAVRQNGDVRALRIEEGLFGRMARQGLLLQLRARLSGRLRPRGARQVPPRRPPMGFELFPARVVLQGLRRSLQAVCPRQICLRLPALPLRPAARRDDDVRRQPLPPTGGLSLGGP